MTTRQRVSVYFAAPLFSEAEKTFNRLVVSRIEEHVTVFLPQRDGGLLLQRVKAGSSVAEAERFVFGADVDAMTRSDILVAVLDGANIDEGVAFELGYMFSLGRPCLGLQTDGRRALPTGNNPMISCSLQQIFSSVNELVDALATLTTSQDDQSGGNPLEITHRMSAREVQKKTS
jgi:nucleoside 2-deoxyribosyltransferase